MLFISGYTPGPARIRHATADRLTVAAASSRMWLARLAAIWLAVAMAGSVPLAPAARCPVLYRYMILATVARIFLRNEANHAPGRLDAGGGHGRMAERGSPRAPLEPLRAASNGMRAVPRACKRGTPRLLPADHPTEMIREALWGRRW
jgi:hypothetical protein